MATLRKFVGVEIKTIKCELTENDREEVAHDTNVLTSRDVNSSLYYNAAIFLLHLLWVKWPSHLKLIYVKSHSK